MAEPDRLPSAAPSGDAGEPSEERPRWQRLARTVGPLVLIVLMVGTALFAAVSVTPQPDEQALRRPARADLVVAGRAPAAWDPAHISDAGSAQLLSQIYEGLTVLDQNAVAQPALAERWSVSDDGRRITFELRPDLAFSDGTPIDAEDVRRSWLRILDPQSPGPLASMLDDIVGAAAYASGTGSAADVGLIATGDRLSVEFVRPAAYFPAIAAVPTLAVVPPSLDGAARGRTLPANLVSSGAYVATEQQPTDIRLEANDRYWAGSAPIGRITVVTNDGGRSNVDTFEDGAVDWTRIPATDASWIRYDRRLGPMLRTTNELSVDVLGFDTSQPPFDDVRIRQAIALSVDWRRLGQLGRGHVADSILPPGIGGRSERDYLPEFDPVRARSLLAEAGYPGGAGLPPITIATYGVGQTDAIAADVERELGIDIKIEQRPFGEHSALLDFDTPTMWTLGWSADFPHAHDFLGLLLRSDSTANVGAWSNEDYDDLIDAAASTADPDEQMRLYGEAQRIVKEQVPLVPLGYGGSWALSREGLTGATPSGVGILRYAGLEWDR
jgi:oligopeptide transport system substrate-binding protein